MEQKNELYYDAMDMLCEGEVSRAKKTLLKSLKIDADFVDAYVGLAEAYKLEDNFAKQKECADYGFLLVKNKYKKWPKSMEWGYLENRAYLRSICDKADVSVISGDLKTAEELYRLLLKMNPNDNQGVRYLIAGMFEGKMPAEVDEMFDWGNEHQNWDKLEKMVDKKNKIHKFWTQPKH